MKILISGGNSKFANELVRQNTCHELILMARSEMDITELSSIESALQLHRPDIFLHTAALSRPMALHDNSPDISIITNIIGTANCVLACHTHNVKFVYISTDFVYPGTTGNYKESDPILPINKYAWSKLGGECSAMLYDNSLILRLAMTEYPFPHEAAFIDCYKSSIWYPDAAIAVLQLLNHDVYGIVNIGADRKSIYDFVVRENVNILPISKKEVTSMVPDDISMNTDKLKTIVHDTII